MDTSINYRLRDLAEHFAAGKVDLDAVISDAGHRVVDEVVRDLHAADREITRLRAELEEAKRRFNDIDLCRHAQAPCDWAMVLIEERDEACSKIALAESALEAAGLALLSADTSSMDFREHKDAFRCARDAYYNARAAMAERGERDARCY